MNNKARKPGEKAYGATIIAKDGSKFVTHSHLPFTPDRIQRHTNLVNTVILPIMPGVMEQIAKDIKEEKS